MRVPLLIHNTFTAGESHYKVGDTRFPAISISRSVLAGAVEAVPGLEVVEWEEMDRVTRAGDKHTGHSGVYFMVARRTEKH